MIAYHLSKTTEWAEAAQWLERAGEARVLAQAGQVHFHRGSSDEGIAALRTFLEQLEEHDRQSIPAHYLGSVYAALTLLLFATGSYDEQLQTADQAALFARAATDERVLARVEVSRALALLALGRCEKAQRVLEEVIPLAEAAGDLDSLARALDNLSNAHYFRGEFDRSRIYLERGLKVAKQMGDPAMIGHMLFMLGTNAFFVGSWSELRAYLERDTTIVGTLGKARVSALPLYGLAQLSLHEGDWETATRYLEDVVQLAEAHTGLGHEDKAEMAVAQAIARATADDDRIDQAYALRACLLLAIGQRRWEDAVHTLDQALDLARHMNFPFAEADYLTAYGMMCKKRGAVEDARRLFNDALTIFQRLGAKKDVDRVATALAELTR